MSLADVLSGALDQTGQAITSDASNILQSTVSGLSVQVKTNLGPPFIVGGQSQDPALAATGQAPAQTGLLDYLGIKFSAVVLDPSGRALYSYGTPPATNYLLVGVYVAVALGASYLMLRGARSFFR